MCDQAADTCNYTCGFTIQRHCRGYLQTRVINDKTAAGFATEDEVQLNILEKIKHTTEEDAAAVGTTYVAPPTPFTDFNKTDSKVVADANPASARSTTGAAIAAFDKA
ncbi:unnamed protein product [Mucor circinelloides]